MGSVKDLQIIQKPTASMPGIGDFIFSDRYSVFDWGEMPDHIRNKGSALCMIGAYFFEKLAGMGVKTHYLGLVDNGVAKSLAELERPANVMRVKLLRVLEPPARKGGYDYSAYRQQKGNFLIPLEIIYRNALPPGSSVFRRLQDGSLALGDIGLSEMPQPGQKLDPPILDVSTKLEATDRYMTWEEAQAISGLNDRDLAAIQDATLQIDRLITRENRRLGLEHEDGKVEWGFDANRQLLLVDVLGTPDECRFTWHGIPVSKEVARIHYRKTAWYKAVEAAKKAGRANWKQQVSSPPPPLPPRLAELISQLYMAFCNGLTGRDWFEAPALGEILQEIQGMLATK